MSATFTLPEWRASLTSELRDRLDALEALGYTFGWFLDDDRLTVDEEESAEAAFVIFKGSMPVSGWHAGTLEGSIDRAARYVEHRHDVHAILA
ncbi:hypothetical protein [Deinococcus pimensis]|uniref:hypothetical protein n=1 Tax=Deinococcus pimensis TaxID=309888 RepID=UPI000480C1BD|nr:hypothetical protein [Deinococcus pimensis]